MYGQSFSFSLLYEPPPKTQCVSHRDNWAQNEAPNKGSVKVYIGAPAASGPGMAHYVDAQKLGDIILDTAKTYKSFGGVMLWDIYAAKGTSLVSSIDRLFSS